MLRWYYRLLLIFLCCFFLLNTEAFVTRLPPQQQLSASTKSIPSPHVVRSATRSKDDLAQQANTKENDSASVSFVDEPQGVAAAAAQPPKKGAIAVLLNRNARSVTDKTVQIAQDVFGAHNVYASSTAEQAEQAARAVLHQHPDLHMIIPMGGDGTLTTCINTMVAEQQQKMMLESSSSSSKNGASSSSSSITIEQALAALPPIAYIPRGTGNGVGSVVACARQLRGNRNLRNVLLQLRDSVTTRTTLDTVELPLLQVQTAQQPDTLCFFAGVGFDSLLLNDFKLIRQTSPNMLRSILGSVTGYCVALVVKTLPSAVLRRRHQIHVRVVATSQGETTQWIDHRRGDMCLPVFRNDDTTAPKEDAVIFDGTAGILAASTVPFYGGGLKLFPFAQTSSSSSRSRRHMHMRIGRIHPVRGFLNIPRIFAGTFRDTTATHAGVLDLLGNDMTVQVQGAVDGAPYPLQHSGESVGTVREFRLRVVAPAVKFVSLWPRPPLGEPQQPRVVVDDNDDKKR